jgi:hypothetical protein
MVSSRTSRLALAALAGAIGTATALVPTASAATQRYASPAGADPACSAVSPCSLVQAVSGAGLGDEVIVAPGDYPLTATLADPTQITIRGVPGKPRPHLLFSGDGQEGLRVDSGSTVRYVEIRQVANTRALFASDGSVDQVVATAPSVADTAKIQRSTITNSLVISSGDDGSAIATTTNGAQNASVYRNVTAIATGTGGAGIAIQALGAAGNASVTAVNAIALGGPGGPDITAHTDSSGAQARINVSHSNFADQLPTGTNAAIVNGGANQSLAPAFVNAAAGDYRQATGSPTIDAGVNASANGTLDFEGGARVIGTTDIGADEYQPVPASAPAPASPAPTPPASAGPPSAFAGVTLASTRLTMARGIITLKLSCPAGTTGRCSGRTRLTARPRRASSRAASRVVVGRTSFSISPGTRKRVNVRVSRAGRRLLNRLPRVRGRAATVASSGAGEAKTTVAAVTIRRRHR